jgi:hypothetical protein
MVTSASLAMKAVVEDVRPVLRAAGFRKRAHTFNRTVEPGLVHVVTFRMGPFDPPGLVEIPGVRENLYGLFSVHLGVFIEEAWRLEGFGSRPGSPPTGKSWVNDYDCQVRRLVDNLAGETMNYMWPLDDPSVGHAMVELLELDAFAWFDRFDSRAAIVTALESAPRESYGITGQGPDRLLAVKLRLGAGDRRRAQEHFDDWVTHCRGRLDAEPHVRGHLDFLADFADRVGLTMPVAGSGG